MSAAVYIGFGSNLGDRQHQFEAALQALGQVPGTAVTGTSRLYETDPVFLSDDGPKFLNAVIALETDLSPQDLARTNAGHRIGARKVTIPQERHVTSDRLGSASLRGRVFF